MSGRWDNRNTDDNRTSGKKTLILLIAIMIGMWVVFFGISLISAPLTNTDCAVISDFMETSEFYNLPDEIQETYYDMMEQCGIGKINVR